MSKKLNKFNLDKDKIKHIAKNISAVVVILSMLVIVYYQNRDRDIFKFGETESDNIVSSDQEGKNGYYAGDAVSVDDKIAYVTSTELKLFDEDADGTAVPVAFSEPVIYSKDEYIVCYNKNSFDISLYKKTKECFSIKSENKIIRAKVNENGCLFLVTEKDGYSCECLVYNKSGETIFRWDVSKSQFVDGDINNQNNVMALSLASSGQKELLGEIVLIDMTQAKELKRHTVENELFFELHYNVNNTLTAVGSKSLRYYTDKGKEKWLYSYGDKILAKSDVSNQYMMVLAFEESGSGVKGNSTDVRVINAVGQETGRKTYDYIADDISVNGESIAIAFGKEIYITDDELDTDKKIISESGVRKVVLFDDDEYVFVIGGSGGKILK